MKIATLGNAAVVHTQRWVRHFRSRGHDVRLWSLERGPSETDACPLPRLPLPGFVRYPLAAPALRAALRRFAPDVVDAHYVPNYGLLGALCADAPLVVTAWGSDLLVAGPRNALQRWRAGYVLRHARAVIADSENLGVAARTLGARSEIVHVVPWGIDLTRFRFSSERQPGLLLSTRMHEPIYDMPTLIEGVAPLLAARPEAELVITGDGRLRPQLERLAATRLPRGRYRFLGRLPESELASWLMRAEVYLSASLSDSTSLSLLEAMACGAVPVVSDLEGNREWVAQGEGARLFRAGDVTGVHDAIESVLANPAWANEARTRNRAVIEQRADARVNMGRIEQLFEGVIAGAQR